MNDQYGRRIHYLRVSVTDRCGLRCRYCMPEEGVEWVEHSRILSYEQIVRLVRAAAGLGIDTVRLTGGEPLVRKGLDKLVWAVKAIDGIRTVTLTTNGVLLAQQLPALRSAGLDGVNLSLDTLDRGQYAAITRRDLLPRALEGLEAALNTPGLKVKLNCVPMGDNDDQLVPLAALARDRALDVRFIELMPIGEGSAGGGLPPQRARALLLERWPNLHPVNERRGNGPAHYEASEGLKGRIGWIDAVSHRFCEQCNRLRLTSTGELKPCLCYDASVDLRALLRAGAPDDALRAAIAQAVEHKPAHHCFDQYEEITEHRRMAQIGG